jgi:hypothetical protein
MIPGQVEINMKDLWDAGVISLARNFSIGLMFPLTILG